jgi:multiple sugar transport system permease protein
MSAKSLRDRFDFEDALFTNLKAISLVVLLAMVLLPFLYTVVVSFRPATQLFAGPHWIPRDFTLEWWTSVLGNYRMPLWNSFVVATGTAILSLLITIPSSYAFGRKEFPGRDLLFYTVIIALLFPYIVLVIPVTDIWDELGLFNTVVGLWVAYQIFVTPFAIWILRDFFENLPAQLEEAAQVYGHTQFSAFVRVILPIAGPALIAVAFLSFLTAWNDFLFSNLMTTSGGPQTAVVQIFGNTSQNRTQWGPILAAVLVIGLPPTVLYMFARRYLSRAFAVE